MTPRGACNLGLQVKGLHASFSRTQCLRLAAKRSYSCTPTLNNGASATEEPPLNPRWFSDVKARIGKCIMFGMSDDAAYEACQILQNLGSNWRDLVAGSEGFLTDKRRAGLTSHAIVWGEQDSMGHVNNVQYVRFAESGRTNWTKQIGEHFDRPHKKLWAEMLTSRSYGLILKSITVDYKFPMTWPDRISVYHKLRNRPDKNTESIMLDVMILSEGKQRPAARCLEDVVVYDYKKGKKTALPPFMLAQFQQQFDLQEQSKQENSAKVRTILEAVRKLETQTWDRADAREDLGSATKD